MVGKMAAICISSNVLRTKRGTEPGSIFTSFNFPAFCDFPSFLLKMYNSTI